MMRILDSIARDRNIDRAMLLVADLEQAMVSAARKYFNTLDAEEFACKVDRSRGRWTLTPRSSGTASRWSWSPRSSGASRPRPSSR
jgi:hypothetical protein